MSILRYPIYLIGFASVVRDDLLWAHSVSANAIEPDKCVCADDETRCKAHRARANGLIDLLHCVMRPDILGVIT
jgi:hypothetical protein